MAAAPHHWSPMTTAPVPPLRRRQFSSFSNSTITTSSTNVQPTLVTECKAFNGGLTCSSSGVFGSCLATQGPDCSCIGGIGYLDCVSAAIATSNCWGTVGVVASADWGAYERSWFQTACPTPPPEAMSALPQPTTVIVELESVQIVPPPSDLGSSTSAAPITQPTFTGAGKLLDQADCRSTSFSLVSADNLIVYAAIVGCMADRPECCPWSVSVGGSSTMAENGGKRVVDMPDQLPMSASSVLTGHPDCCSSAGAENKGDRVAGGPGRFPTPANSVQARLSRCPDDYYSVSGQCCPNGFYRFTRQIAFQTPCFSGAAQRITPPLLTAGLAKNPTDTSLPTSAIVNFILAMGFNVSADHTPPLTESVAIGVGVGAGVFGLVMISLTVWLIFRVRRSKRRAGVASAQPVEHPYHDTVGTAYPQGYGTPSIASPPGSPQSPGQIGPHAHARQFSNSSVGSGWTSKSPQGEEAYGYPLQVFQPPQPRPGHYQQPQQGSPQYGHPQVQPPPQPQGGYGGYHERG